MSLPSIQPTVYPTETLYSAYSDSLRLASIGILFLASMLGVVWPLWYYGRPVTAYQGKKLTETDVFFIARSLAAGIMLGVAFIHLLAEGTESLATVVPDYSSLGFTLATCGIMFVLAVEQAMISFVTQSTSTFTAVGGGDDDNGAGAGGKTAGVGMGDGDGNDACGEECVLQGDCDVHGGGAHSGRVARGVPGGSIVPTVPSRDIEMHTHALQVRTLSSTLSSNLSYTLSSPYLASYPSTYPSLIQPSFQPLFITYPASYVALI